MLAFLKQSLKAREGSERLLWILLLLFVFSISFSIAVSHIFLSSATLVYLYWKFRHNPKFPRAHMMMPALAYIYFALLAVVFSIHPSLSLFHAKDLLMFVIIPIVLDEVHGVDDIKVIYGILILAGVISCMRALMQMQGSEADLIHSRIRGFMGHWMTFSGLLMILNVLLLSHLLFAEEHPKWFYPAFALLSITLLLTFTRNAWLGFLAAAFVLIAMRRVRYVIAIPLVAGIIFLSSILVFPSLAERIGSIFNPQETSNRDRVQMIQSGWEIIKDYPLTGVGTGMVKEVYPRYRPPNGVLHDSPHLHNNLVQLAAEDGIFTLLAWLWLFFTVVYDLVHWKRNVMNPDEQFIIHGTIGVVIALFVAGMFEYNFGDSEIRMLFFVLITLPYAWRKQIQVALEPDTGRYRRIQPEVVAGLHGS